MRAACAAPAAATILELQAGAEDVPDSSGADARRLDPSAGSAATAPVVAIDRVRSRAAVRTAADEARAGILGGTRNDNDGGSSASSSSVSASFQRILDLYTVFVHDSVESGLQADWRSA